MAERRGRIRVLVVDDSSFLRRSLPRILETDQEIAVVGTAANGDEAVRLTRELRPDVVTLDILMPVMDGLTALKLIMRETPTAVLMVSSATRAGADATLEALSLGAVDFIEKPSGPISLDVETVSDELIAKVRSAYTAKIKLAAGADAARERLRALVASLTKDRPEPITTPLPGPTAGGVRRRLVAIAASTGGPAALQALIPRLPRGLPAGIVIVQHIAPGFTRPLAERLNAASHIAVREAEHGELVSPGVALLAPADRHMAVAGGPDQWFVRLSHEPADTPFRPSANVLFQSVARACGSLACGVILTGMGDDGAAGLKELHTAGGLTIAQDEATSLIFGMPRRALETGAASQMVPLDHIAAHLVAACRA